MSQFNEFQSNQFQPDTPQPDQSGSNPPNLPPVSSSRQEPRQERLRHVLYGSLDAIDITIKNLHARNYADPGDWSDPIPVPPSKGAAIDPPQQWMAIMTKLLLLE